MKNRLAWLLVPLFISAALVACSDDEPAAADINGGSGTVLDRADILDSLEDVRALVEDNAASLDPMIIGDVDYSDGELRVMLAESQNGLDTSGLQKTCDDVGNAIALPDMKIVVEKADGSESVECEFGA